MATHFSATSARFYCCCATLQDPMARHQRKAIRNCMFKTTSPQTPEGASTPQPPNLGGFKGAPRNTLTALQPPPPPPWACPEAGQGVPRRAARATKRGAPPPRSAAPVRPPSGGLPVGGAGRPPPRSRKARPRRPKGIFGSLLVLSLVAFHHTGWLPFTRCRGPAGQCSA